MKTVAAIHTAMPMVVPTRELFSKHIPYIRLINIVDDSMTQDVIGAGEVHITEGLAEGAFLAVIAGDNEKLDQLILDAAVKVISSPESGLLNVKDVMESL